MLSTISSVFPTETLLGNPPATFQGGFTPWESLESFFATFDQGSNVNLDDSEPNPSFDHSRYHAGLDNDQELIETLDHEPNQDSPKSSVSGSDGPNQNFAGSNSGSSSDDSNKRKLSIVMDDERKRRRMLSNRESARRSRMRKQTHLDNLRNQVNRLKIESRERTNQLRFLTTYIHHVTRENDRLKAEHIILQRRLMEISKIMQLQQLHQNYLCMSMQ